jgi:hypothetical protein
MKFSGAETGGLYYGLTFCPAQDPPPFCYSMFFGNGTNTGTLKYLGCNAQEVITVKP